MATCANGLSALQNRASVAEAIAKEQGAFVGQTPFIHLAVRTSFSLLESMIGTKGLTKWCVDQGLPAVAVTDPAMR